MHDAAPRQIPIDYLAGALRAATERRSCSSSVDSVRLLSFVVGDRLALSAASARIWARCSMIWRPVHALKRDVGDSGKGIGNPPLQFCRPLRAGSKTLGLKLSDKSDPLNVPIN